MSNWSSFLGNAQRSLFSQAYTHGLLLERIMLETPKGAKILEAGCGLAYLSRILADCGYCVTAGDIDEDVLTLAEQGLHSTLKPIRFLRLDLFNLVDTFEGEKFDAIIHSGVMEHFTDDMIIKSFVQQRAVADCLIFKVPNIRTKMSHGHFGDERFMSNRRWSELLREGGYTDIRLYGGESAPSWTKILPAILLDYPKTIRSSKSNRLLEILSAWRKHISRHTIFVCS